MVELRTYTLSDIDSGNIFLGLLNDFRQIDYRFVSRYHFRFSKLDYCFHNLHYTFIVHTLRATAVYNRCVASCFHCVHEWGLETALQHVGGHGRH